MRGVEAVFIDIDSHRIRSGWHDDDGELLIVLGQTFTIGSDAHVARRFHDREAWMTTNVPTREIERCGQDAGLPVLQTRYSRRTTR